MANIASLRVLLKELKLASYTRHWEDLAQKALDDQWLPQQYLAELCEQETAERHQKRLQRYTREAQLPPGKQLAQFDFSAITGVKKNQVMALVQQPNWVKQAGTLLLFGASGVGKTHLACGIAYGLIDQGLRVKFTTATSIVQSLQQARVELTLAEALVSVSRSTHLSQRRVPLHELLKLFMTCIR